MFGLFIYSISTVHPFGPLFYFHKLIAMFVRIPMIRIQVFVGITFASLSSSHSASHFASTIQPAHYDNISFLYGLFFHINGTELWERIFEMAEWAKLKKKK